MHFKSFTAGILLGIGAATATVTLAKMNVVGGVIGVTSGYGAATAICVDKAGEINAGSKIETIPMPIGDQQGRVAHGVTFRCP